MDYRDILFQLEHAWNTDIKELINSFSRKILDSFFNVMNQSSTLPHITLVIILSRAGFKVKVHFTLKQEDNRPVRYYKRGLLLSSGGAQDNEDPPLRPCGD